MTSDEGVSESVESVASRLDRIDARLDRIESMLARLADGQRWRVVDEVPMPVVLPGRGGGS